MVQEQYLSYPLLRYLAELCGYIGLFLGVSLNQLADFILYVSSKAREAGKSSRGFGKPLKMFIFAAMKQFSTIKTLPYTAMLDMYCQRHKRQK